MKTAYSPIPAFVVMNTYAGRLEKPVIIVGETKQRYRITVEQPTILPRRTLEPGQTALVPMSAVVITNHEKTP